MNVVPMKLSHWGRECRGRAICLSASCQQRTARLAAGARQAMARLLLLGIPSF